MNVNREEIMLFFSFLFIRIVLARTCDLFFTSRLGNFNLRDAVNILNLVPVVFLDTAIY